MPRACTRRARSARVTGGWVLLRCACRRKTDKSAQKKAKRCRAAQEQRCQVLRPAAGSGCCCEGLGGTIRVGGVPQVDAVGDRKVEHLLQLGVHALLVAPEELVAPRPVARAPSGAVLLSSSIPPPPEGELRLENSRRAVAGRHTMCRGPSGVLSAAPWGARRQRGSPGSPWGSDPAARY